MEKQTIAILGWGSLIWDSKHPRAPEFDKWHEAWMDNGPRIKLEFSRISTRPPRQGVLTLVIDPAHGSLCNVQHCLSRRTVPDDAFEDLAKRENMTIPPNGDIPQSIGRIFRNGSRPSVCRDQHTRMSIQTWADTTGIDVVTWTDLPSNFLREKSKAFSVPAALAHLEYLDNSKNPALSAALEYIREAPSYVRTDLRSAVALQLPASSICRVGQIHCRVLVRRA